MDKIYSRRRIKIFYSDNKTIKKKLLIALLIVTIIVTVVTSIRSINPIFEELCKQKAITISTDIVNNESTKVVHKYDYKDIVSINKTEKDNILKTDVTVINDIASDIAVQITKKLKEKEREKIKIPIGALLGNKYLAGMGPAIEVLIVPAGTVKTDIKTEFKACGINQTIYRIYLEVTCNVNVVTSYKTINTEIVNQVLLVETVVVGNVPETYYNLEGMDLNNAVDIIE